MPADPRKRQKQQERRAAKRKAKHHQLARAKHAGLGQRLTAATKYPVLHAWVTSDFHDKGMGWACLSRELPNRSVAFAVFLVDRYCLGVKNAMANVLGGFTYDQKINTGTRSRSTVKDMAPAAVRKLVESAVAYAQKLGFPPHPDYHKAKLIFGDINASQATEEFEFGQGGMPFFIAGPNDDQARCQRILRTLEQTCGAGNYHYLLDVDADDSRAMKALESHDYDVVEAEEDEEEKNSEADAS